MKEVNNEITSIVLIFSLSIKNPRTAVASGAVFEITDTTVMSINLIEY